jgi:hypothetical protein
MACANNHLNHFVIQGELNMRKFLFPTLLSASLMLGLAGTSGARAASDVVTPAKFLSNGQAMIPQNYRSWIFVGAPLTPNALNAGKAPFPEYHNVYMEPSAFKYWKKNGKFAEGTQIVKELVLIRQKPSAEMNKDGSTGEVSGVGYFPGEFQGLELAYKSKKRFPKEPGGWVYFSFGHKTPPYAKTAKAFPTESCNACHQGSAATDYVFTQFYPVLRAAKPKK